jgi:hypothetical protein
LIDAPDADAGSPAAGSDLRELLHQLNNQLGVILAHAELLENKAPDTPAQDRAARVVNSALGAMATVKAIRARMGD